MTLIEISVAITILSVVVALMYGVIDGTIRGASKAREGLKTPKVANAVLGQIFKDFRYIYWGGLSGDAGFLGKNGTLAGMDADKVSFITARRTRLTGSEADGVRAADERTSPLTEVGYINAHGTSTLAGDISEIAAIQQAFGQGSVSFPAPHFSAEPSSSA